MAGLLSSPRACRLIPVHSALSLMKPGTTPQARLDMNAKALKLFVIVLVCSAVVDADTQSASSIAVRYREGLVHGFLVLSALDGEPLAHGELAQVSRGDRVTTHVWFRFKDGSVRDETTIFSQRGHFRLLNYRVEQKGPAFPYPLEMSMDTSTNRTTVHYTEAGKEKVAHDQKGFPADIANGLLFTLVKNIQPGQLPVNASIVVATPKPRLVKLAINRQGEETFTLGDSKLAATHYDIKLEIGGIAGTIAPLVGKQPPDIHVWVLGGEAPVFVKSEGPLFAGGPIWRIELTSPVWHSSDPAGKQQN